jgi:hypothetical protein
MNIYEESTLNFWICVAMLILSSIGIWEGNDGKSVAIPIIVSELLFSTMYLNNDE